MAMVACPACFRVCIFDDHDHYSFIDGLWGTDGQLDAMDDAGGLACDVFWGCCSR